MKVNYNGYRPMPKDAGEISLGQSFEYDNYYYMVIRLDCKNLHYDLNGRNLMPIVNIHSGTVRLIDKDTHVWPLQSKCSLRQGHTHEELNGI